MPCILKSEASSKGYRKNWARLIQKIYEADPLTCPKCQRADARHFFHRRPRPHIIPYRPPPAQYFGPRVMCQVSTILMSSDEALLTTINPSLSSLKTDAYLRLPK